MPSMKAIRRRRVTVDNIQQITKAMNLVATSKLQRARAGLKAVEPLLLETKSIMQYATAREDAKEHPIITPRDVKNVGYVIITSDRGLCGGYNSNICKVLVNHARELGKNTKIVAIGTKGRDFFTRRDYDVIKWFNAPPELASFKEAEQVSATIMNMYQAGDIDEIYIAYTHFGSVLHQEPTVAKVFPVSEDFIDADFARISANIEFDPNLYDFLTNIAPVYLSIYIYCTMVESVICEQASRMTSMDSATKNAEDIIEKLTLMINRQRQSIITQEITEIVSGANALQ